MELGSVKAHGAVRGVQYDGPRGKHDVAPCSQSHSARCGVGPYTSDSDDAPLAKWLSVAHEWRTLGRGVRHEEFDNVIDGVDVGPCFLAGMGGGFDSVQGYSVREV